MANIESVTVRSGEASPPLNVTETLATQTLSLGQGILTVDDGTQTGNTIYAASASQPDVEAAIAAASPGDTVVVPAGSATWGGLSTLGKQITLQGQGPASTIIVLGGCSFSRPAGGQLIVDGFRFDYGGTQNGIGGSTDPGSLFILRNCELRTDTLMFGLDGNRALIHNNLIRYASVPDFGSLGTSVFQMIYFNEVAWDAPPLYGADDTGYTNTVFEDNTIIGAPDTGTWGGRICLTDADEGSRVVYRYNDFYAAQINSHGAATSRYGIRHFEIYGNNFYYPNSFVNAPNGHVWFRGGSGTIHNNYFEPIVSGYWNTANSMSFAVLSAVSGSQGGTSVDTTYPVQRQLGWAKDGNGPWDDDAYDIFEGVWISGNTGNDAYSISYDTPASYIDPVVSYTAKPGYTEMAYPHPLRGAA